jgi:uncharacterized protein (TIGR02246 family)
MRHLRFNGKGNDMTSDEQEIRQLVATWMSATKAGDIDTVLGLMTEDVVFLIPGRSPMQGRDAYAAAARPQPGQPAPKFDGTSDIQEVTVCGDLAYMWTNLTVVVTPPGSDQTITRTGSTLTILKKQNGRWLLARDANLLVTVSKPTG